ncbi:hypothetical protein Q5P01_006629 [Channa striata]|uniref:Uncharacterized protein n=1 Tax=Channa striata TaxID=64152 RepID=A0AA88SYY1_CHASR|nr:hypothetical protein Q5P01_006629 [Channa striata]
MPVNALPRRRRRQQRHRRPGVPEPGVAVPQPVPTQGIPDPDEDHAGSGSLSDGPGEPDPGRQLCGSGSHHIAQSPALVSLLGWFLCASLWTDRSGVMEEASLSCGECPLNASIRALTCQL